MSTTMIPLGDSFIPAWLLNGGPTPDGLYECLTEHCDGCGACDQHGLCDEATLAARALERAFRGHCVVSVEPVEWAEAAIAA